MARTKKSARDAAGASQIVEAMASMSARERRMLMRIHVLKGKLDMGGGEAAGCVMEEEVWGKMPEDILCRVLLFVPAAKLFQFQLVCRKWRLLLSSTDFQKEIVPQPAEGPQLEPPAVACVTAGGSPGGPSGGGKVLDVDLSFVPNSFWKSGTYSVLAAKDGLVCISDGSQEPVQSNGVQRENNFCVINPLTRTCKFFPKMPLPNLRWLEISLEMIQLQAGMLTVFLCSFGLYNNVWEWAIANFDMEAGQWSVAHGPVRPNSLRNTQGLAHEGHFLLYNGEVYTYGDHRFQVHSMSAAGKIVGVADIRSAGAVDFEAGPLDVDTSFAYHDPNVYLVGHQGTVYFMAKVKRLFPGAVESYGIWKLVRSTMAWEPVSMLERPEIDRMTRSRYADCHIQYLLGASGAGELLCFEVGLTKVPGDSLRFTVGFNVQRRAWELVHDKRYLKGAKVFEPRPDIFLF